ncbi:hypothetical protein GIB67_029234, partial [Kingdonia uniflora]
MVLVFRVQLYFFLTMLNFLDGRAVDLPPTIGGVGEATLKLLPISVQDGIYSGARSAIISLPRAIFSAVVVPIPRSMAPIRFMLEISSLHTQVLPEKQSC